MSEIKLLDRVKINLDLISIPLYMGMGKESFFKSYPKLEGIVTYIEDDVSKGLSYHVEGEDGEWWWFNAKHITVI